MNVDNTAHRHISAENVAFKSLFVPLVTSLFKLPLPWLVDYPYYVFTMLVLWIDRVYNFQLRAIAKYVKLFFVREIFPLIATTKNYTFL
ncbi:MAG: hypothetical protein FWG87_08645 [Defluviitaleaceae bacterium]|nr:hypothetical protein [Defluviitaleaceae bacterium]